MDERNFYLTFSLVNGIGPKTFNLLLKHFESAEKAWNASSREFKEVGLGDKLIQKFEKARSDLDIKNYLERLKQKKASFIALCDKNYPQLLREIPNPPIVLYVKGDTKSVNLEKTIGIVGTRRITNYGREVTKLFSLELASNGFTVVSGLAMGVDAVASSSAIEAGGKTIAVLGNGVDLCFPTSNENLYDKILNGNGVIVSEFPLGQGPTLGSFPSRNRIIAGLSLGVLVTEGAKDSGSLITADYAFKFNRKVFAVPGPITSSLSVAPLKLIEKGAKLVTSGEDISKELGIKNYELRISPTSPRLRGIKGVNKDEGKILLLLENESLGFDQIVRKMNMNSSKVGSLLSVMEIKGLIKNSNSVFSIPAAS